MQRCYGCMKEYGKDFNICPHCGYIADTVPESKYHLRPGTRLADKYVLGKVIGHGGFGITYIAWDSVIQKRVAVKEFFPNAFSTRSEGETAVSCYNRKSEEFLKEGIRKMLEEAKRLSSFSATDNVVDIFDFFEANNTAYIVMEYLDGKDLKKLLEENGGSLKPERAIEIIMPVLNALEDMHKEKVIHRDISPDNIFICGNGKVKLLDFGSARLAVDDSEKSLSVMVKRGYAPREQYASRSKQGPWTDVYAACATLYRMITGETPLESTERDEEQLKPFSTFGIKGYDSLENLIAQGLVVDYTERIQSVAELKNALEKILEGKKPVGIPKKKSKKAKKNIKIAVAVAASVAVVVGAAFAIKYFAGNKKPETETTTTTQPVTIAQAEAALSEAETTGIFAEYLKSKDFAKENPAVSAFVKAVDEKDLVYNGSDLKPESVLIFDSEPITVMPGSAKYEKHYFDVDGDGIKELFLSVNIRLTEGKDRETVALFDIDTENGNKVFKGAQWEKLSSTDDGYNHLKLMDGKTEDAYPAPFSFVEYNFNGSKVIDKEAPATEDYGKDCRKSYYNGSELVYLTSISISDCQLLGLAQPRFIKCDAQGKSIYMNTAESADYPVPEEIQRLTYEQACQEWDAIFSATQMYGYCDHKISEFPETPQKIKGDYVTADMVFSWYAPGCLLIEPTATEMSKTVSISHHKNSNDTQWVKLGTPVNAITSIALTEGITNIDAWTFEGYSNVKTVFIPEGVTEIGEYAFRGCSSLRNIVLPESLRVIGTSAFAYCESIESVALPEKLVEIGIEAFLSCTNLSEIYIPASVTEIGYDAFHLCRYLKKINVAGENKYYSSVDGILFSKDKTKLIRYPLGKSDSSYVIPEGVQVIANSAFKGTNLTEVSVPKTVTLVEDNAFDGCNSLRTVNYTRDHLLKKPEIRSNNDYFKNARTTFN